MEGGNQVEIMRLPPRSESDPGRIRERAKDMPNLYVAEADSENELFEDACEDDDCYPMHKAAFKGDRVELARLLRKGCDVGQKDVHGNTALHIAVMLGHTDCALLLLNHGAPVKAKNLKGWSSLAEAVSYGDRYLITAIMNKSRQQLKEQMQSRRPHLIKALERIQDFYMELRWDFQSWVPLVSRILPSDICKIYKRGSSIRMDTTLVDFNDMKWERGDVSFIFNSNSASLKIGNNSNPNSSALVVMDNETKAYQMISNKTSDAQIDEEVNLLMGGDIIVAQLVTKDVEFIRSQSGWFFREDKRETVGSFQADVYAVHGICLETKKRREHLSEADLARNKEPVLETLTRHNSEPIDDASPTNDRDMIQGSDRPNGPQDRFSSAFTTVRRSLTPPPKPEVTWEEYIRAKPGDNQHLGRPLNCKTSNKSFKATLAMSKDFPMTVEMLLNILEVVTPFKHLKKLREFVTMKLPPGFPVKIEIPILPTITAKITFQEFAFRDDLKEDFFQIPPDYVESTDRFAGL